MMEAMELFIDGTERRAECVCGAEYDQRQFNFGRFPRTALSVQSIAPDFYLPILCPHCQRNALGADRGVSEVQRRLASLREAQRQIEERRQSA